jgi:uncharacterized membrane protein YfcA
MEIAGYLASLMIGISLGLIGGGGSILTVPVLVYLFAVEPVIATVYSLFIVGVSSFIGVLPKYKQGMVKMRTAMVFGIPSITAVFLTRKFIVPSIPQQVATINGIVVTKSLLLMLLFAIIMVLASVSMIMGDRKPRPVPATHFNYPLIIVLGLMEGTITGLVGAGGGFLIIPVLVLLAHLPMKQAIGTSLLIIAVKSLIGFAGDLSHYTIHWPFLLSITLLSVTGIFVGSALGKRVDGLKLKKAFGWFVLIMGMYILTRELFFSIHI